jgi:acetyltransferase-like isoleucine patch superfamily enzyme
LKRFYWKIIRVYNTWFHLKKGALVEIGYAFRFSREEPYRGFVGEGTIIEEFNVWNAKAGDLVVGKDCWFGLHNIIMGPVEIGDNVSTGPHVSILGPRHAILDAAERRKEKTRIGDHVWISTGAIVSFGITVGHHAIIGPGSVVTQDVPGNTFVSGNPARNLSRFAEIAWKRDKSALEDKQA